VPAEPSDETGRRPAPLVTPAAGPLIEGVPPLAAPRGDNAPAPPAGPGSPSLVPGSG
jgi:hypothetical protein